jgi:c-di-AMP phosphodiesterase-like protein
MNQNFKKHLEASYTRAFEECARTGHKVGDLDAIFNSIAMATFAELIVGECAKFMTTAKIEAMPPDDKAIKVLVDVLVEDMKHYFGVDK